MSKNQLILTWTFPSYEIRVPPLTSAKVLGVTCKNMEHETYKHLKVKENILSIQGYPWSTSMQYSFLFWIKWFKISVIVDLRRTIITQVKIKIKIQQEHSKDTYIYNSSQVVWIGNKHIFLALSAEKRKVQFKHHLKTLFNIREFVLI